MDIRIKGLTKELVILAEKKGLGAVPEYQTGDGTRVDVALLMDGRPLLAVEFENSYKWIKQRVLYNAVKAHRAGFRELWVVYPFKNLFLGGWLDEFISGELGLMVRTLHPDELIGEMEKRLEKLLEERNPVLAQNDLRVLQECLDDLAVVSAGYFFRVCTAEHLDEEVKVFIRELLRNLPDL